MTRYHFRLKASSKAANTIIAIPQVRFTLKSGAMSARFRERHSVPGEQRT